MAKTIFGNHAAVLVPEADRDKIRKFYCDILGGTITKADPQRDFVRLGPNFFSRSSMPTFLTKKRLYAIDDPFGSRSKQMTSKR